MGARNGEYYMILIFDSGTLK